MHEEGLALWDGVDCCRLDESEVEVLRGGETELVLCRQGGGQFVQLVHLHQHLILSVGRTELLVPPAHLQPQHQHLHLLQLFLPCIRDEELLVLIVVSAPHAMLLLLGEGDILRDAQLHPLTPFGLVLAAHHAKGVRRMPLRLDLYLEISHKDKP